MLTFVNVIHTFITPGGNQITPAVENVSQQHIIPIYIWSEKLEHCQEKTLKEKIVLEMQLFILKAIVSLYIAKKNNVKKDLLKDLLWFEEKNEKKGKKSYLSFYPTKMK